MNQNQSTLVAGSSAVSLDHGLVKINNINLIGGVNIASCTAIPSPEHATKETWVDEVIQFDTPLNQLTCPLEWQINTAIESCEARIDNGANIKDSFSWLRKEIEDIREGKFPYDFN